MEILKPSQLKKNFVNELPDFNTTADLCPHAGIIGQKRAETSLKFGLTAPDKGYNIYVSGVSGLGKTTFAVKFAQDAAKAMSAPPDLCYAYNFSNPKSPVLLTLSAGMGKTLQTEMDDLAETMRSEFVRAFSAKDFEENRSSVFKRLSLLRDDCMRAVTEKAKEQNFGIKTTNNGIYFLPIINGEMISEEQFDELTQEQKDEIGKNAESVHITAADASRKIKEWEKSAKKEIENMEFQAALFLVGRQMEHLFIKYTDCAEVLKYLKSVKESVLENVNDFLDDEQDEDDPAQGMFPWYPKKNTEEVLTKYKINLLTDNAPEGGAPVILEHNPTYSNLVGEVEYDNEYGNLSTDFMKIKPGAFLRANGGFLIMQISDVLGSVHAWETVKRALRTGTVTIEPLREFTSGLALSGVNLTQVSISVKVILIGSYYYYNLLAAYDDEFKKLFKVCADFDYEMKCTGENINGTLGFIKAFQAEKNAPDFSKAACVKILDYSLRLAENQKRLAANFGGINDILSETLIRAKAENAALITGEIVEKAIAAKKERSGMYEEKLSELINENIIMIDVAGKKIGQINGLAVLEYEDCCFAKPSKITATTYVGKAGIINIEKEAEMSGSIHDKGIQVIIGFLGSQYAQDFPLSLSCRICFEQNYNGVDGDSASSTELFAVLSSLSGLPINQEIAVTGSINQFGDIQPIGGVTQKIEGFFDLCKERGLTGGQGVIIPKQNVADLCLKDEVIDAVSKKRFTVYAITHINEGVEILTGVKAGEKNAKGQFPESSVHGLAMKKLKSFYKKAASEESV